MDDHKLMRALPVVLIILGGIVGSLYMNPINLWMGIALAMFGMILLGNPRRLFIVAFLWFATRMLLLDIGPRFLMTYTRYLDEAIFLGFCAIFVGQYVADRRNRNIDLYLDLKPELRAMAGLFAYVVFFGVLYHTGAQRLIHFCKSYLMFIPMCLIAVRNFRASDIKKFVVALKALFILQLILNVAWMFRINPLPNIRWSVNDFAIGTLGGCNLVSYFCVMFVVILGAEFSLVKDGRRATGAALWVLAAMFQIYITYTSHAYFLLGIIGLVLLAGMGAAARRKGLILIGIATAVLLVIGVGIATEDTRITNLYDTKFQQKIWRKFYEGPKVESARNSFVTVLREEPLGVLTGVGPARYMSTPALVNPTPLAYKYLGAFYLSFSGRQAMGTGSVVKAPIFGNGALYGELGPVGFFLYLLPYLILMHRVRRNIKNEVYVDEQVRAFAYAFTPICVTYFLINFLHDYWDHYFFSSLIVLSGAMLWNAGESEPEASRAGSS